MSLRLYKLLLDLSKLMCLLRIKLGTEVIHCKVNPQIFSKLDF